MKRRIFDWIYDILIYLKLDRIYDKFWYRIYYRHTKKCKSERKETRDRVLAIRKKVIGK